MATGIVVSDTSTLLALIWLDRTDLILKLFGQVHAPVAVKTELDRNLRNLGLSEFRFNNWMVITPVRDQLAVKLLRDQLDVGESEAIVLAHELGADLLLMDERRGRRRALQSNLTILGTLGILLRGHQLGFIVQVRPLLNALRQLPFHMSDALYADILRRAGELDT
ncbi:MAG: DUF3368 domain-containing protein [Chloroflexi bacterium]|nr:DUF3368 domain-containing protein [Chloroflexota bacterium]